MLIICLFMCYSDTNEHVGFYESSWRLKTVSFLKLFNDLNPLNSTEFSIHPCYFCVSYWPQTCFQMLKKSLFFRFSFQRLHMYLSYVKPSRHLLVQSQQWKHKNNVWNIFKVDNVDPLTPSMTFWCLYWYFGTSFMN